MKANLYHAMQDWRANLLVALNQWINHSIAPRDTDSRNTSSTSASLIARLGCTAASPRANWGYWCRAALQFRDMVQVGMVGRWQKYCQGWKSHLILVTEHRSRLSSKFPTQKSCPLVSTTQCFLVQEVLPGISPVHSPSGVLAKMAPIGSKTPKKRSSREFLLSRQLCIVVAETIDVARLWQRGLDSSHFNEESSSGA